MEVNINTEHVNVKVNIKENIQHDFKFNGVRFDDNGYFMDFEPALEYALRYYDRKIVKLKHQPEGLGKHIEYPSNLDKQFLIRYQQGENLAKLFNIIGLKYTFRTPFSKMLQLLRDCSGGRYDFVRKEKKCGSIFIYKKKRGLVI